MMHLSSYYSDDNKLRAEVHRYDELTYVAVLVEEDPTENKEKRIYFNNLQDAENTAEDFIMKA